MRKYVAFVACGALLVAACSDSGSGSSASTSTTTGGSSTTVAATAPGTTVPADPLLAGAASRSILPTVNGARDYLAQAPGWKGSDPNDIGVFVPTWDQGKVDVGNGESDGSWVHDDMRTTALALRKGGQTIVMVTADLYMVFKADSAEVERRARAKLTDIPADSLHIVVSATHVHHGPDTAFSVNKQWYDMAANQMVDAIVEAVGKLEPATVSAGTGTHRFGQADAREPDIVDPHLNVLDVTAAAEPTRTIATVVQWGSHPETTLGWEPPGDHSAQCAAKGWTGDQCFAKGRYFTADYPGVLREQLQEELGGEVLYFNGAVGSQIGPEHADVWLVDAAHPEGDGVTPPAGAQPVAGAKDFRDQNMARTAAIGAQLAVDSLALVHSATPVDPTAAIEWQVQPYYTRLTNIGFRVLLSDGSLGWQTPKAWNCTGKPFTDANCVDDGGAKVDDPVLTPLVDSQVRKGDVLQTQLTWVRLGDVGFLFMPGELPPELVIGLPSDFVSNTAAYYPEEPTLHATGADYVIPGALLDLVPTKLTFTVGLGGDELGYWTPINEVRLKCLDIVFASGSGESCQHLFDAGLLVAPDAVAGPTCRRLTDTPPSAPTADEVALQAVCRYGQALGRELGEPSGHYEETNSASWDLVDDTWAAATTLFRH